MTNKPTEAAVLRAAFRVSSSDGVPRSRYRDGTIRLHRHCARFFGCVAVTEYLGLDIETEQFVYIVIVRGFSGE
jgi:hypothetical protein